MTSETTRIAQIAAAILLFAGCAGDRNAATRVESADPQMGGIVVVASSEDLGALNPLVSQTRYAQELNRFALFMPLVTYGPNLEIQPGLATSWEMTGDTGAVFRLRTDVHWHDGVLTTAADAEFTIRRALDSLTAYPGAGDLVHWTGVEATDSFGLRISWRPHSDPLAPLPFLPIAPRHVLDSVAPDAMARAAFNRAPVGNGPFRFVEYQPNDRWVFEANPDYPESLGGRPRIDRLVWRIVPDNVSQVAELRTGGADLILNATAESYASLVTDSTLTGLIRESRQYAFIGMNGRRAPFGDARVRRAIMLALDRERMIQVLRGGHGTIAVSPIGSFHWAWADSIEPLPFDPAAARALLAEAGITDRDGDGTLDLHDGRPFTFTLAYPAQQAFNRDLAELAGSDLSKVGIRMAIEAIDYNTLIGRITSGARDFDAVLMGWESDYRVNMRDQFHSAALSGQIQIAGYANAEVDELINRTELLVDRDAARPLFHRLQRILRDEVPWGLLYYFPDLYVARSRLHGARMDIRGAFVNLPQWWVSDANGAQ